ncbi:D-2-hydroxyacid dehydrogenase [uncultured Neptuniibacter sp.]|uniref:D-2-hydroxyacid dehydrogenase n=1 Tax=uncultured Neptuniibacter sp. TaxID=502143 RepID=UPI00262A026A|nr:D-2-hydroxyacid dehydrogenase [uncultured Neptuniibacter sp.]
MRAVILDLKGLETLDLSPIEHVVSELVCYELTSEDDVADRIRGFDIVITNKTALSEDVILNADRLQYICVLATGTNVVDKDAALKRGVPVSNCVAYGVDSVVQHVWSLILALHTNLLGYVQDVRQGEWQRSDQFCFFNHPIAELKGRTLGIVGYGNLGRGVARIAEAFGMDVIVSQRIGSEGVPQKGRVTFEQLIQQADVISLHCPLTEKTENLFDRDVFKHMKSSAFLINAARGGIVNEPALVEALTDGEIAAAATDVLTTEPPKEGNVLIDASLPNLLITPHIAWGSVEARTRVIAQTAENISAFCHGETVRTV